MNSFGRRREGQVAILTSSRPPINALDQKVKSFYRSEKLTECIRMSGETAKLLGEFLEE